VRSAAVAKATGMRKVICFERRTSNSPRTHFNRAGDWRPRLIVWPEYEGKSKAEFEERNSDCVDDETDASWGRIVAATVVRYRRKRSLESFAFELVWPSLWERITSKYALLRYQLNGRVDLTEGYVNLRQHWGHEDVVFLLAPASQENQLPRVIRSAVLDRANLLPYGNAIFDLGTEEAVLEIAFDEHDSCFLEILRSEAQAHGHLCEQASMPFISHWVVANHKDLGDNWREF
jgi:hypothetical protein